MLGALPSRRARHRVVPGGPGRVLDIDFACDDSWPSATTIGATSARRSLRSLAISTRRWARSHPHWPGPRAHSKTRSGFSCSLPRGVRWASASLKSSASHWCSGFDTRPAWGVDLIRSASSQTRQEPAMRTFVEAPMDHPASTSQRSGGVLSGRRSQRIAATTPTRSDGSECSRRSRADFARLPRKRRAWEVQLAANQTRPDGCETSSSFDTQLVAAHLNCPVWPWHRPAHSLVGDQALPRCVARTRTVVDLTNSTQRNSQIDG